MTNLLDMSDDEIMNMSSPPAKVETTQTADTVVETTDAPKQEEVVTPVGSTAEEPVVEAKQEEVNDDPDNGDKPSEASGDETVQAGKTEEKKDPKETEAKSADGSKTEEPKKEEETSPPNYEAFYNQIMTPFKANGKTIKLQNPDEAIKLMQMGANYTKKLQELNPHRKVLTMLQNNNLLDESKLSYLIDLDKKNPDAIKKLVKDSGIDPLDINTAEESAYKPTDRSVTDEQVNFDSKLQDIMSTEVGKQTVHVIDKTWDAQSKEALWTNPEIMDVIQTQRELGVYDQIVEEIDRQKMLGTLSPNTPFLQAYKTVGDQIQARNGFVLKQPVQQQTQEPVVVATRTATPKAEVANGDKARAAASTKTTPSKAKEISNPLAMSDDDFLKQMANRL